MNGKSLMKYHCTKKTHYINLNMESITDANYMHVEGAFKDFETKNLREYPSLYLKSNILILPNVFENIRKNVFTNLSFRSRKISFSSGLT